MLNDTMELLKIQMEEKINKKSEKKNKYASLVQQSMLEEKEIKQMQNKIKEDKAQLQRNYAKALEAQMAVKKPSSIDVGNRRAEDASNKLESSPKGMVPGIFNIDSVGSRAIYRTGVMIAKSPSIGMSSKYMNEVRKLEEKKKAEKPDPSAMPNIISDRYNTITNPIPMATSNPYLMKQLSKIVKM